MKAFKFLNICVHLWMLFLICAFICGGRVAAGGHSSLFGQGVIMGLPTVFGGDPNI